MGILVFTAAVLPALGDRWRCRSLKLNHLAQQQTSSYTRLANTAKLLYTVYLGITIGLGTFVLRLSGLPIFESLTLSLGTVGTGRILRL